MSKQVTLEAGELVERLVSLADITKSHNPRATRRGVLERFHEEGRAHLPDTTRQAFVSYMIQDQPEIEELRISIEKHGLLQAPTVRAFRSLQGEEYVERYGIVQGEGRILAHAVIEAMTGVAQSVLVRIEPRMTVDQAFERGLAENIDRHEMNPVDLATAFHEMLTIRINPATKGEGNKGRPYTLKELAARVNKTYWWVRDHEAVFYLPDNLKARCIADFRAGKRNMTRYTKLGLKYKAQATGQPEEIGLDNQTQTEDNVATDATIPVVSVEQPTAGPVIQEKPETEGISLEPVQRRRVLSLKAVQDLFDKTPLTEKERLKTLAEVMGLDLESALQEREIREGARADAESRRRKNPA